MKKVFYFSLMVMTMFLMTACSSSGPGDAMKKYGNYLIKGDYEKFVDGLAFDESVGAEKMKEQKDGLVSMLKEKVSKEYEKKDGLKSIEIISEEISEDGNSATVKIKQSEKLTYLLTLAICHLFLPLIAYHPAFLRFRRFA